MMSSQAKVLTWAALSVVITIGAMAPIIASSYYSDDIINANVRGILAVEGRTLLGMSSHYAAHWFTHEGRVFPLIFFIIYPFWHAFGESAVFVKVIHIAVLLAAAATASGIIWRWTRSAPAALANLLIVPLILQTRAGHDPLLSFPPLLPLITLMILGQALLFDLSLRLKRRWLHGASVIVLAAALLTYEVGLVGLPLSALTAYVHARRLGPAIKTSALHLAVCCAYVLLVFAARKSQGYGGASVGSIQQVPLSFAINLVSAVPYSYWFFDPHGLFKGFLSPTVDNVSQGLLLGALFMIAWVTLRTASGRRGLPNPKTSNFRWAATVLFGLILFLAPSFLVALSARYQGEVTRWGEAYLPTFMATFGLGMMASCILGRIAEATAFSRQGARLWLALGVLMAPMPGMTFALHQAVVAHLDSHVQSQARHAFKGSLRRGLFDTVANEALILVDEVPPWLSRELIWSYSGKFVTVSTVKEHIARAVSQAPAAGAPTPAVYRVRFIPLPKTDARAFPPTVTVLTRVDGLATSADSGTIQGLTESHLLAVAEIGSGRTPALWAEGLVRSVGRPDPSRRHQALMAKPRAPKQRRWQWWELSGTTFAQLSVTTNEPSEGLILLRATPLHLPASFNPFETASAAAFLIAPAPAEPERAGRLVGMGTATAASCSGLRFNGSADGVVLDRLEADPPFSLWFWARPDAAQRPIATLVSNHGAFQGLTLERDTGAATEFAVYVGTGSAFQSVGRFTLQAEAWNLIAVHVTPEAAEVYMKSAHDTFHAKARLVWPAGRPLHIGNFAGGGRSFAGSVAEMMFVPGPGGVDFGKIPAVPPCASSRPPDQGQGSARGLAGE